MQRDFLQSEEWRKFQESVGRRTFHVSTSPQPSPYKGEGVVEFWANIVEHKLPVVGKYFYIPRGPIIENQNVNIKNQNDNAKCKIFLDNLINLAKENNIGWIRIDVASEKILEIIKKSAGAGLASAQIFNAPHDMQPREIFVIDISKSEEELSAEMKAKTRYNIKLAEKKGVKIFNFQFSIFNEIKNQNDKDFKFYIDEFLRLNKIMARRQNITAHQESYYRKMLENISPEVLKLYVAEYQGKIIAANIMVFYGDTCTYLHGASDDKYKNVMAPYLLQWQAIKDAKKAGCKWYDFGGIKTKIFNFLRRGGSIFKKFQISNFKFKISSNSWAGITKFKLGFSPNTAPVEFLGSYDIIINRKKYFLYRFLQRVKIFFGL